MLEYVQPKTLVKIIWLDKGLPPERQKAKQRCLVHAARLAQADRLEDKGELDEMRFTKLFVGSQGELVNEELKVIAVAPDTLRNIEFHAEEAPEGLALLYSRGQRSI